MKKRRTHIQSQRRNDGNRTALLFIGGLFAVALIVLTGSRRGMDDAQSAPPQSAESKEVTIPSAGGKPPWYPFKSKPKGAVKVPDGSVRMTQEEAARFFLTRFEKYVEYVVSDAHELPYVKRRMMEFVGHSRRHDPIRIAAIPHYAGSITVPASIGPSSVEAGKAVLELYIPYWVEQDRHFTEEYVRDSFVTTVIHELIHYDTGFWRPEREHAREAKVRDEAFVWGETCANVILPMRRMGRAPVIRSMPQEVCLAFERLGGTWRNPEFIRLIETTAVN